MPVTQAQRLTALALDGQAHRSWYSLAQESIRTLSLREYPANPEGWADCFIDLLAIYSPRVQVTKSVRLALHHIRTGRPHPATLPSTRLALAHYNRTGEIRGPKTSRFAAALKGDKNAVVLDVWMSVALRTSQRTFERKRDYARYSRLITRIATSLGWTPAETQAAIWSATYRLRRNNWPGPMPVLETAA